MITNGTKDSKKHKSMSTTIKHHYPKESFEPIPMLAACLTYLGFYFLMLLGFLNQLLFAPKVATESNREVSHLSPCTCSFRQHDLAQSQGWMPVCYTLLSDTCFRTFFLNDNRSIFACGSFFSQGYAPLYDSFEQFYLRYVYRRIRDCFNRPICSVPGDEVTLKDRITKDHCWTFEYVGNWSLWNFFEPDNSICSLFCI